jgi:sortase A
MTGRGWRIAEALCLIGGLALLDLYIWSRAGPVIYQAWENGLFQRAIRQAAITPRLNPPAPPQRLQRGALVGRLEVPRLGLTVMVKEGSDEEILAEAVGHLPSSPLPGTPGNVAVAGHRDTFFRPLKNLRLHDRILFTTLRGTFEYEVESEKIVRPTDVSVLRASAEPTLTLVTCYPFYYVGSAPKRFIARARQVAPGPLVERASLQ